MCVPHVTAVKASSINDGRRVARGIGDSVYPITGRTFLVADEGRLLVIPHALQILRIEEGLSRQQPLTGHVELTRGLGLAA
jgi:hypothetical protein